MSLKSWREWFISPDSDPEAEFDANEVARVESGTGHRDGPVKLKRKLPPRCAKCRKFMGHNDGMYVLLTAEWRVHINCFNDVLQRHFDLGEAIDFETGCVVKVDWDTEGVEWVGEI